MTTETGPGQAAHPASEVVAQEPAWLRRLDQMEGRQRRMIVVGVELAALTRYLASRRFAATVIVAVIGVRALATLGKESQTRTVARVVAWDRARAERERASTRRRQR